MPFTMNNKQIYKLKNGCYTCDEDDMKTHLLCKCENCVLCGESPCEDCEEDAEEVVVEEEEEEEPQVFRYGRYKADIPLINTQTEDLWRDFRIFTITKRTKCFVNIHDDSLGNIKCKIYTNANGREYIKVWKSNIVFGKWDLIKTYADELSHQVWN